MLEGVDLVIYDLDGVLIDATQAIVNSFRLTFREIGEPLNPEEVVSRIGYSLIEILRELLPEEHRPDVWRLRDRYIAHFQEQDIEHTRLLPDVAETLETLKARGYMQSLATNKTNTEADRILTLLGVRDSFNLLVGFMDVPNPKPAPDMINLTLERLGVPRERAIFVDDTTVGLTAGIGAGVKTIGITTGTHSRERLETVKPDYIIDEFRELLQLLGG
ncbi:MAG: HAD family hydrolase [Candidatus Bathyarchaeota archaeon]